MNCLKMQKIFSTHLIINKKALNTKCLSVGDKYLIFDFEDL